MTADGHPEPAADPLPSEGRYARLRHAYVTPQSIYGTLLVAALIGAVEEEATDGEVLVKTGVTVFVFWFAHVFADAIGHYGSKHAEGLTMRSALGRGIHESSGLLWAAVVPCILLALGAVGALDDDDAYNLALAVPVVFLFGLGWFALADRGGSWFVRLLGSLATGVLGLIVILLKIVFH